MREALVNARVLVDGALAADRGVVIEDGRIAAVASRAEAIRGVGRVTDLGGGLLLPGFVDTQVNGGGGALFNDDPSVATIRAIGAAHRRFGTTSFLPTLISDDMSAIARAIDAVRRAIEEDVPGVIGIHIEGPCLNEKRKGAHDADKFRGLEREDIELLSSLGAGRTLVTLAPEMTTPDMIAALAAKGVVVSAGHTNGTYADIVRALAHGLTGFTHLFNAMSPLTSREPGVVGAALEDAESWCGLIVDGHHVDPAVLRVALRCKRLDRFVLVTDAMPPVGTGQESFMLQGRRILVRDGLCVDEQGTITGSALDMASAVRNAVAMLGVDLPAAVKMASAHPAAFLRLENEIGGLARGRRANLVHADDDVRILRTWIDGRAEP